MSRFVAALYDPFMRKTEAACLRAWRAALRAKLSIALDTQRVRGVAVKPA